MLLPYDHHVLLLIWNIVNFLYFILTDIWKRAFSSTAYSIMIWCPLLEGYGYLRLLSKSYRLVRGICLESTLQGTYIGWAPEQSSTKKVSLWKTVYKKGAELLVNHLKAKSAITGHPKLLLLQKRQDFCLEYHNIFALERTTSVLSCQP